MGSGTTGAIAKLLGRHFIGIEREKKYVLEATKRIAKVIPKLDEVAQLEKDKKRPKILFHHLLKKGVLIVGDILFTPNKKRAKILSDGRLKCGRLVGSIHQLAATLQNKTVANGWDYWLIKTGNEYKSIDILRKKG